MKKKRWSGAREAAGEEPLLQILPFKKMKAGLVTTGNEVYAGLIEDTFSPVIRRKLAEYGCEVTDHVILDDSPGKITDAIRQMLDKGLDMVLCTGGMSVDPDDKTPLGDPKRDGPGGDLRGAGAAGSHVYCWPTAGTDGLWGDCRDA